MYVLYRNTFNDAETASENMPIFLKKLAAATVFLLCGVSCAERKSKVFNFIGEVDWLIVEVDVVCWYLAVKYNAFCFFCFFFTC